MRLSDWQIRWNPLSSDTAPMVLLDMGDSMSDELSGVLTQLVASMAADFARSSTPVSRRNAKRQLDLTRVIDHEHASDSWIICHERAISAPWGEKGVISIRTRSGGDHLFRAGVLSIEIGPEVEAGVPTSTERWSLILIPLAVSSGEGVTIIGGWYNPPSPGAGAGGSITVTVPGGSGVTPGSSVHVSGVPGVVPGYYPVISVSSGGGQDHLTIAAAHDQPVEEEAFFQFVHGVESSSTLATAWRAVAFTSTVPFEVWSYDTGTSSWGWESKPAGSYQFDSEALIGKRYLEAPRDITGSWSGLTAENSPVPVAYNSATSSLRWRRVGGATGIVSVPMRARGEATFSASTGGNRRNRFPDVPFALNDGGFIPPPGIVPQGGTITPATIEG